MDRYEAIREQVLPVLLPFGVEELALFGSVARGEETIESDIDILVCFAEPPRQPLSLITWGRLERELEKRCGRKVDLVSARGLSRHLRPVVDAEKVILYTAKTDIPALKEWLEGVLGRKTVGVSYVGN